MSKTKKTESTAPKGGMIPGQIISATQDVVCNVGRKTVTIDVANVGDRPIQVGSHYHFFETNKKLQFDREKAFGMRLNIVAGTAIRFEPGEKHQVTLVEFAGKKMVFGHNGLVNGSISTEADKSKAIAKAKQKGFMK